jgi:hypothetical protein
MGGDITPISVLSQFLGQGIPCPSYWDKHTSQNIIRKISKSVRDGI